MNRIIAGLKNCEWSPIDDVDVTGVMVAQRMLPAMTPLASSTSPAKDEEGVLYFKMPQAVRPRYYPTNGVAECDCQQPFLLRIHPVIRTHLRKIRARVDSLPLPLFRKVLEVTPSLVAKIIGLNSRSHGRGRFGPDCWHTEIVKLVVRDSALCRCIIARGVIDRNETS